MMPDFVKTLIPEQETVSRQTQVCYYIGMLVLMLVCGLTCTMIGITITDWRNSLERQQLIASYSQQIRVLTDELLVIQSEQTGVIREVREVAYDVHHLVFKLVEPDLSLDVHPMPTPPALPAPHQPAFLPPSKPRLHHVLTLLP